ncbi:MAG: iron-sulfur cluster assembly scaffold protein [Candidatus Thorarchaeota archaeon]|nr:iron-sulfur cluster assembly scaffold protein [Candidatus Thorarchaeota archaeon]
MCTYICPKWVSCCYWIPEPKIHCSVMAADGLREAIKVYREKKLK